MNSCELVIFISTLACAISECYTEEEVELMGTVFTQLGDTLTTISTHNTICNEQSKDTE